jgi:flagellar biosynthesis component FlhA
MGYPMKHLEAVILRRLSDFIGHDEVARLARQPEADLSVLTTVFRALLKEETPIIPLDPILDLFRKGRQAGRTPDEIVESIRFLPEIRPALRGNGKEYSLYRLAPDLEIALGRSTRTRGGRVALSVSPQVRDIMIEDVKSRTNAGRRTTILVENTLLRPLVWTMLDRALPGIAVLSLRELQPELKSLIAGEIALAKAAES